MLIILNIIIKSVIKMDDFIVLDGNNFFSEKT